MFDRGNTCNQTEIGEQCRRPCYAAADVGAALRLQLGLVRHISDASLMVTVILIGNMSC